MVYLYFIVREYFIIFLYHIKLRSRPLVLRRNLQTKYSCFNIFFIYKNGISKVNSKTNIFDSYVMFE